jgi:cell division protein FtsI/penicillin-binding protein 2
MASRAAPARRGRRRPSPERLAKRRVRTLTAVSLLALVLIAGRAAWVAVVQGPHLSTLVAGSQERRETLMPVRGAITDDRGVPLAISLPAKTVGVYPKEVSDAGAYAHVLAPILRESESRLAGLLRSTNLDYVYLAQNRVPSVQGRVIRALRAARLNPGVLNFEASWRRTYPSGLARQLLGATHPDGTGFAGVELSLNDALAGKSGSQMVEHDAAGQSLRTYDVHPPVPGRTQRLTVDSQIQDSAEGVAASTLQKQEAKKVIVLSIDVRTGGILAMASAPGIPAGGYAAATPTEQQLSAIVEEYEPGSTFKAVTMAAALGHDLVTPSTTFEVPYRMTLFDYTIEDADYHPTETLTVSQILQRSSNIGTVTIARSKLGEGLLKGEIADLGFGKTTGVDLPGEIGGSVPKDWSGTSILSIPIGLGVAVTPIQIASLYQAIANGGVRCQPHIVDAPGGDAKDCNGKRVFSANTAHELVGMLSSVVTATDGTGTQAAVPGYTVAGKTGTAPKFDQKEGRYDGARAGYESSFVGMVPASRPRIVTLVLVDSPKAGSYYGGDVAAPAFSQVGARAMQVLGVPQDHPAH